MFVSFNSAQSVHLNLLRIFSFFPLVTVSNGTKYINICKPNFKKEVRNLIDLNVESKPFELLFPKFSNAQL